MNGVPGRRYAPRRILVVRLSSLGDVVLAFPLLRALRRRFSDAAVHFLTRDIYRTLVERAPGVETVWVLGTDRRHNRELRRQLTAASYDLAVDLQNNLRTRRLIWQIGVGGVCRYRRPRLNRFLRINFPKLRRRLQVPAPVPLGYLGAVSGLGVEDDGGGLELPVPQEWVAGARRMVGEFAHWGESEATDHWLVCAPGARHGAKIWPSGHWVTLLERLYESGWTKQILVGNRQDAAVCSEIARNLQHQVVDLAGRTTLPELAGVLRAARAVIAGDTGSMHLAAGVGVPVVAIFGPTVPEFGFAPFRAPSRVVQVEELVCRPCHPHGPRRCPLGHFRCMKELAPAAVEDALRALVGEGPATQTVAAAR